MSNSPSRERLLVLDLLRGVAALAVVLFHFIYSASAMAGAGWVRGIGFYGQYGVHIFFVISGFVIPFAMAKSGYRLRDFGRFQLRRQARLFPPYIITALLGGLLLWVASRSGVVPAPTGGQWAAHLVYANDLAGVAWFVPVFWTLAIEFQYYLLIGLIFPLVVSKSIAVRLVTLSTAALLSVVLNDSRFITPSLTLFFTGIVVFQYRAGISSGREAAASIAGLAAVILSQMHREIHLWFVALLAVGTAAAIAWFPTAKSRFINWLGEISFSLYLLHTLVGMRVLNLMLRGSPGPLQMALAVSAAVAASLFAAWLFHRFVERPAQTLSSRLSATALPR